jgi:hypothetical protein
VSWDIVKERQRIHSFEIYLMVAVEGLFPLTEVMLLLILEEIITWLRSITCITMDPIIVLSPWAVLLMLLTITVQLALEEVSTTLIMGKLNRTHVRNTISNECLLGTVNHLPQPPRLIMEPFDKLLPHHRPRQQRLLLLKTKGRQATSPLVWWSAWYRKIRLCRFPTRLTIY